ncbi:aldo/keto reductase [Leucobacter sp. GX24907]
MRTPTNLGGLAVSPIGYGCMALSSVYGGGLSDDDARAQLDLAIDAGVTLLDTSDVYGDPKPGHTDGPAGTNEEMLAPLLARRRNDVQIATKFGITGESVDPDTGEISAGRIDGRPEYVRSACEASLRRLGIDTIDLYYLHRPDLTVPIEETVGAMAELVQQGKVRHLGLSEVTVDELRRANAVHSISALQSEWSLWSRDVEARIVPGCAELGVGFVPYSPLGRGFLTGTLTKETIAADFRGASERMGAGWDANQRALAVVAAVAEELGAANSQVALAWLFAQGARYGVPTVPIPGSRRASRMIENLGAADLSLSDEQMTRLNSVAALVSGGRSLYADNPDWTSEGRE